MRIENKDLDRSITVEIVEYDKDKQRAETHSPMIIRPGSCGTFYVHLLRDLRIRELKPT